MRGRSRVITEPAELVDLWTADELRPWVAGSRTVFITIPAMQLTGRLIVDQGAPT